MSAREAKSVPIPKRSGSETRRRGAPVSVRLLPEERAAIAIKAREAGLRIGGYLRACGLGSPGPRAKRSPPVNAELLGQAIAALNRAGNNLNQIAHMLNAGRAAGAHESATALAELRAVLMLMKAALGRKDRP